nr:MAG TPA: hypothetical protein [Caudoviricetes sp.]
MVIKPSGCGICIESFAAIILQRFCTLELAPTAMYKFDPNLKFEMV